MALPPTMAPAGAPPADLGAAPGAPAPEMGGDAGGWNVAFTIMRGPTGEFALVKGDEPEMDESGAPMGPKYPDGPAMMQALMGQIEGKDTAQAEMQKGFDGGSMASDKRPGLDMARGG